MAVAALKRKPRAEEWCVEAESPEEARELLAAGRGGPGCLNRISASISWSLCRG